MENGKGNDKGFGKVKWHLLAFIMKIMENRIKGR